MGIAEPPVAGALLQVKNIENVKGAEANSSKGLMLPRVNLKSIDDLNPILPQGYKKDFEDSIHAGLMVFNTNDDLPDSNGVGLYVWSGENWMAITEESNSIEVTPNKIFLSEYNPSESALLAVGKNGQLWKMLSSGVDDSSTMKSVKDGKNTDLTFTRSTSSFGNKIYTFILADKPTVQTKVEVCNLDLQLGKSIIRVGAGSVNGAVNSSTAVVVKGGDAQWEVVDYSKDVFNWLTEPKNENGRLVFVLGDVKGGGTETVKGQIVVRHINEPRLTRTIIIEQNQNYISLPPFDFLVIKYGPGSPMPSGSRVDIDSATEIMKSGMKNVDNKPVGFIGKMIGYVEADGEKFMFYAGDDKQTASETSYVDVPKLNGILDKYPYTSNQIEIGMSAWWYNNTTGIDSAMVTISVYKGGQMVEDSANYTFNNIKNGIVQKPLLSFSSSTRVLNRKNGDVTTYTYKYPNKYTPMFKLEYDRVDNTGVLIPWSNWE